MTISSQINIQKHHRVGQKGVQNHLLLNKDYIKEGRHCEFFNLTLESIIWVAKINFAILYGTTISVT